LALAKKVPALMNFWVTNMIGINYLLKDKEESRPIKLPDS
jgi:hypothetical protein